MLLLIAAADGVGDPATVLRAAESLDIPAEALAPAEAAGLVAATPVVEFRHPLLRTAIYHGATLGDRRHVHRALADVLDGEGDADRRAWHAAEAVLGPDEEVAAELERSAERARRRSGFAAESAYLQRAADLTADPHDRVRLLLDAARAAQIAGSWAQADTLLTQAQPMLEDARQSADVLRLRAALRTDLGRPAGAVAMMLDAAERLERVDVAAARDVMLEALHTSLVTNPIGGSVTALDVARAIQSGHRPEAGGHALTELVLEGLAARITGDIAGAIPKLRAVADALLDEREPDARQMWAWFGFVAAVEVWDHEAAHVILERMTRRQRAEGALLPLRLTLLALASILTAVGRLADAEACYDEVVELTVAVGQDAAVFSRLNGPLLAWQGKNEEARATLQAAIAAAIAGGIDAYEYNGQQGVVALEVSASNYGAVRAAVAGSYDDDIVVFGNWALPELIEAAKRLGDDDSRCIPLERLAERATAAGNPWGLGLLARSRALVADDEHAESCYRDAIALLERTSVRTDLARAHLLYGEWLRRQKRRTDARAQLRIAYDMFSAMGAAGSRNGRASSWSQPASTPPYRRRDAGSISHRKKLGSRGSPRNARPAARLPRSSTSAPIPSTTTCARCSRRSA